MVALSVLTRSSERCAFPRTELQQLVVVVQRGERAEAPRRRPEAIRVVEAAHDEHGLALADR